MSETTRPMRADARRNRDRILSSAGALFAERGVDAQMEEIAAHSGLGMGTLYRHFPSKKALLTAMVGERFRGMAELAQQAEKINDPLEAFETMIVSYLEAAEGDAAFQLALMGSTDVDWDEPHDVKTAYADVLARIISRAVDAGVVRQDLTLDDFPVLVRGVMATMHFDPTGSTGWRRHLELVLGGVRRAPSR